MIGVHKGGTKKRQELQSAFLFFVAIHEASFISFVVFSEVYMLVTCVVYKWAHSSKTMTHQVNKFCVFENGTD